MQSQQESTTLTPCPKCHSGMIQVAITPQTFIPDGNVTGLSLMSPDLAGKRLELLKELLPRISRVAVIWNAANPYPAQVFRETENAAPTLGMEVQSLEVDRK